MNLLEEVLEDDIEHIQISEDEESQLQQLQLVNKMMAKNWKHHYPKAWKQGWKLK